MCDWWKTSTKFCQRNGCGQRCDESAWSFVISAVMRMKANGARNAIAEAISSEWLATATRKRCRRTEAGGRRRVTERAPSGTLALLISARASGVVHPAARVPEDDRGHREGDDEQHHRERAGVAHEVVHERRLVEQDGVEERRVLRVAQVVDRVARLRGLAGGDVRGD